MADVNVKSVDICKTDEDRFNYLKYVYLKTYGSDPGDKMMWDGQSVVVKTDTGDDNTEFIQRTHTMMNKINANFYKNTDMCIVKEDFNKFRTMKMEIQDSIDSPVLIREDIKDETIVIEIMGWNSKDVLERKQKLEYDLGLKRISMANRAGRIIVGTQRKSIKEPKIDQDNSETADRNRFHTYEGINVYIRLGNIEDWTEDNCCIVNPTNEDFKPKGGVSIALLKKGGRDFEKEMENLRPKDHKPIGECRISRAGRLRVSKVIHLVCPSTRFTLMVISDRKCTENIFKSIFNCMKKADENKLTSIVFPFIYTGKLARSVKECCLQYAYAVLEYSRNTDAKSRNLKKVNFVCNTEEYHVDAMRVFRRTIPSDYGQLFRIIEEAPPYENIDVHRQYERVEVKRNFDNQDIADSVDEPETHLSGNGTLGKISSTNLVSPHSSDAGGTTTHHELTEGHSSITDSDGYEYFKSETVHPSMGEEKHVEAVEMVSTDASMATDHYDSIGDYGAVPGKLTREEKPSTETSNYESVEDTGAINIVNPKPEEATIVMTEDENSKVLSEHTDSPVQIQRREKPTYSSESVASPRSSEFNTKFNYIKTQSVIETFGGKIEVVFVNKDIRETQVSAIVCPIGTIENADKVNGNELTGSYIKAAYHNTFFDSKHENKRQKLHQQKTTKKFVSVTNCVEDEYTGRKAKYLYHVVLPVYEDATFEDRMNTALDALLNRIEKENKSKKRDVREVAFPLFGLSDMLDVDTVKIVCGTIAKCLCECVSNRKSMKHLVTKVYIMNRCPRVMSIFEDAFTEVQSSSSKVGRKKRNTQLK